MLKPSSHQGWRWFKPTIVDEGWRWIRIPTLPLLVRSRDAILGPIRVLNFQELHTYELPIFVSGAMGTRSGLEMLETQQKSGG